MALALYRKYRPRTFAEVIGQEHVTEPLSQALRSGRLHHAYLFSGPRGCGKTSSARILARSLNCEQGPTPDPCGVCGSCKSLANDGVGSIDVIEIDAASHGGVDDARELREKAFFAPAASRYKIYVIDEAHMVSPAGFNALLKLVEEPPDYVKFIFATTEPEKVLGTIRSRTHHYPFRLIPPAVLRPYLQQLTEAEGIYVEPAVFPLVVRAGAGSARDSLSVLDQLIAGAGPEGVGYARAVALLGVTDVTLIDEMCDALAAGDGATAYATIDRVAEAGHDPRRFASDLLERFRDLIVLQQVPDAVTKGLIDGPADQLEAMSAQATRLGPATLSRCADIVHNGLVEMRGTTAPRLLLELITARMLLPGAEDSTGALLQRLERMERRLTLSPGDQGVRGEAEPAMSGPAGASSDGGVPVVASSGAGLSAARAAAASAGRRAPASGSEGDVSPAGSQRGASTSASTQGAAGASASGEDDGPPWAEDEPVQPVPAQARKPESAPVPTTSTRLSVDDAGPGGSSPVDGAPSLSPAADVGSGRSPVAGDAPVRSSAGDAPVRPAAGDAPVRPAAAEEPVRPAADDGSIRPAAAETMPVRPPASAILPDAPEEPDIVEPVSGGAPGQLTAAAVREVWPEIIAAVGRQSKKIAALASGATVRDLDGQTVVLTFRFPAHAKMVSDQPQLLVDALYEALGGNWKIRCEIAGEAGGVERGPRGGGAGGGGPAGSDAGGGGPAGGMAVSGRRSGNAADQKAQRPRTQPSRQREAAAPPATRVDEGDDWPEPVRPGGAAPAGDGSAPAGPEGDEPRSVTAPDAGTSAGAAPASAGGGPAAGRPAGSVAEVAAGSAAEVTAGSAAEVTAGPVAEGAAGAAGGTAAAGGKAAPSGMVPGGMAAARAAAAGAARQAAARSGSKGDGPAAADHPPTARAAAAGGGAGGSSGGAARVGGGPARVGGGPADAAAAAKAAAPGSWSDGSPAEEPPYDPEYDGPPAAAGASFEGFDPGDEPLDDVIDEKAARQSSEQQAMQLLRDAFGAEKISET